MAEPVVPEAPIIRSPSPARVAWVELCAFRGVPGSLQVSFVDANHVESSAIIFGENGSGKSTIADAVEWACQKTVGRKSQLRGSGIPSLINLAAEIDTCSVQVSLSTGQVLRRWATFTGDAEQAFGDRVPEIFARAPMSLKRADILRFLDTPAVHRGSLFLDHALGAESSRTHKITTDQMALVDERLETKRLMRDSAAKLAALIGVMPAPHDANDIEQMVANDVYKGVRLRDRHKVVLPRPVQEELDILNEHRGRVRELNKLASQLRVPSGSALERLREMQSILNNVGDWLTGAFISVTGADYIQRIEPVFGRISDVSLEIDVVLTSGTTTSPRKVFSEGYEDLVALLYFLAVA